MNINDVYFSGSKNPKNLIDVYKHNSAFNRQNPTYFKPEGITIFCGSQGQGKSLSAVQFIKNIIKDFPNCVLVTNTEIYNLPHCKAIHKFNDIDDFTKINNGIEGVIYFIDEIHMLLNSLESKNISIATIKELSQGRKQRKLIVGTSQVYNRMAKPLREQVRNIVLCKKVLGCIQINTVIDGDTTTEKNGELKYNTEKRFIWFHSPKLYNSYDTFAKIEEYIKKNINNNFKVNDLNN